MKDLPLARVVKAGYIEKKGGGNRRSNWQKRWFVLEQGKLSYYESSDKKTLKGTLLLETGTVVSEGGPAKDKHATSRIGSQQESLLFCIITASRTLLLCGSSIDHVREWVEAIQTCLCDADDRARPLVPASSGFQAGHMEKLGGAQRMIWQKRWFVLSKDGVLKWFKSSRSKEPRNWGAVQAQGLVCDDVNLQISVSLAKFRSDSGQLVEDATLRCLDEMSYRSWTETFRSFSKERFEEESIPANEYAERLLDYEPDLRRSVETRVNPALRFTNRQPIGKGSFGQVFKAKYVENGEPIALKILTYSERNCHFLAEELRILDRCDHPSVLGLLGCWVWKRHIWITTEFCEMGDLVQVLPYIRSKEHILAALAHQVLLGIEYLSSKGIVHRDIKGENILVTAEFQVRIADLGLAVDLTRTINGKCRGSSGTPGFMAPEVLGRRLFDAKADIYSFGCLLLEMGRRLPSYNDPLKRIYTNLFIGEHIPSPTEMAHTPRLRELAGICTAWNPEDRPTPTVILGHLFFEDRADQKLLQQTARGFSMFRATGQAPSI